MINQLRDSILSELQEIDWVAELYDWIPTQFNGFPSIFFNFDRVESVNLDSNHHERVYFFNINLVWETNTRWSIETEKSLSNLLDTIIDIFDRSDFNWLSVRTEAVGWDIQAVETSAWPALHWIIALAIHTVFSIS